DPAGNEVTLQTVDLQAGTPYGALGGPRPGGSIGATAVNETRYIDVTFPDTAGSVVKSGLPVTVTGVLNVDTILDLAPEFRITTPNVELDPNLAPVHLQGNTFRSWTKGGTQGQSIAYTFMKET